MPVREHGRTLVLAIATFIFATSAYSQSPQDTSGAATQPADSQPAASRAANPNRLRTRVIDVVGDVQAAPIDSEDWKPVKLDDELDELTKIRTGIFSSVKLLVGEEEPYTAVLVESVSQMMISEAAKSPEAKRVRLGLSYGQIRAGVAEGGLRSEMTVDSPVATLSKRGTWNFGMYYERGTDRYEVFLLDRGLVQAINRLRGTGQAVKPGERVTEAARMFLDQAQIDKNIPIADVLGQGDIEVAFNRMDNDGLGVLGPGQGRAVFINLSNSTAASDFASLVDRSLQATPPLNVQPGGPIVRPEGFFGTGRGDQLVELIIQQNDPLAKGGFARPGKYQVRRQALESWMRNHRR